MKQNEKKVVAPSEQCDRWPWMSGMQLVHTSYFKAQSLPFFADFSLQPQRALSLLQFQGTTLNVFVAAVGTKEQLAVKGIQRTERKKTYISSSPRRNVVDRSMSLCLGVLWAQVDCSGSRKPDEKKMQMD
jgi:hypothetical protein